MPVPEPQEGEDRDSFIDRCIENETIQQEFGDDENQSYAVCANIFENGSAENRGTNEEEPAEEE
jgi:hypothetical protein